MVGHKPEDVIDDDWLQEYIQQRQTLWLQLIDLNCNVFLIEKILHFPFSLFLYITDEEIFWQRTINALIDSSILIIWKIAVDKHQHALTLNRFKDDVLDHICDSEAEKELHSELHEVDFDRQVAQISRKIEFARQNYVAHLNAKLSANPNNPRRQELALNLEAVMNFQFPG